MGEVCTSLLISIKRDEEYLTWIFIKIKDEYLISQTLIFDQ